VPTPFKLAVSIDLEEWFHSGRWLDGQQAVAIPDTRSSPRAAAGDVLAPTNDVLELFARHGCRVTFFVLGELARWYPGLVRAIAAAGHEIACHGLRHVDMAVLGPARFRQDLIDATAVLADLTGTRPIGYRAPNLVYAPWATAILEEQGYVYDSSVCAARPLGGKYAGWLQAPMVPYVPSYEDIARRGDARIVELPLPSFPWLRVAAGSGITTRVFGYHWSRIALRSAIARGDTSYYFHSWEIGPRPPARGPAWRNAIFRRRTGPWMRRSVARLLTAFEGRICTARELAERARQASGRGPGGTPAEDQTEPSDASAVLALDDDPLTVR
jgi:peptidoglycan-N-acetylglucosamine deacetylase